MGNDPAGGTACPGWETSPAPAGEKPGSIPKINPGSPERQIKRSLPQATLRASPCPGRGGAGPGGSRCRPGPVYRPRSRCRRAGLQPGPPPALPSGAALPVPPPPRPGAEGGGSGRVGSRRPRLVPAPNALPFASRPGLPVPVLMPRETGYRIPGSDVPKRYRGKGGGGRGGGRARSGSARPNWRFSSLPQVSSSRGLSSIWKSFQTRNKAE